MLPTDLALRIQSQKKYKNLPLGTIERAIHWASQREKKPKLIEKVARKKLHQIFGAYLAPFEFKTFQNTLQALNQADDQPTKENYFPLLKQHHSTAERVGFLESFYDAIFEITGPVKQVLDLASGLNPLGYLWFQEHCESYHGGDLDAQMMQELQAHFQAKAPKISADVIDLLAPQEPLKAEMIWIFKTLPCLEQQEKGASLALLKQLDCKWLIISYPTQTLSGKNKGMAQAYQTQFEALIEPLPYALIQKFNFENEMVFVLKKTQE